MHDVPRQSVGEHLGFGKDDGVGRDELDDRLARKQLSATRLSDVIDRKHIEHARYIYNLQENADAPSSESEEDSWDSDDSGASWRKPVGRRVNKQHAAASNKKRMSLLTGQYYDVPVHENGFGHYECGMAPVKSTRRRFFQSGARWDEGFERVLVGKSPVPRALNLGQVMENGGQMMEGTDEDWEDGSMAVDS